MGRRSDDDFKAMLRQLRLDADRFAAAVSAPDADTAVADDVAKAAALKLPKDAAILLDGEPLRVPLKLTELEARLLPKGGG